MIFVKNGKTARAPDQPEPTATREVNSKKRKNSEIAIEPPALLRVFNVWNFPYCDNRFLK